MMQPNVSSTDSFTAAALPSPRLQHLIPYSRPTVLFKQNRCMEWGGDCQGLGSANPGKKVLRALQRQRTRALTLCPGGRNYAC